MNTPGSSEKPITSHLNRRRISRRMFVKASVLASAAVPLSLSGQSNKIADLAPGAKEVLPSGKIGKVEFSRLIMGGNLIGGYAHSRDLRYVSTLMRRYNTPAKIRETLELGEQYGITAINTFVMDDNSTIFDHWKAGGKMKWIAQARMDAGGGCSQIQRAIDEGASAVHLTGDAAERLLAGGQFEKVAEAVQYIKTHKNVAGVAAHDLRVIEECEKLKIDVDFYQKTLHSHDYFTAPREGDSSAVGANDNSWCSDPQAVIDVFAKVRKPWIAFKILAAGAIPPRAAFPYAFTNGADFILVGMFDWQIAENAQLAKRVVSIVSAPGSKRTRTWDGAAVQT